MRSGLLIAYFQEFSDARHTIRRLGKSRFLKTALLHRDQAGNLRRIDPFLRRRCLGICFLVSTLLLVSTLVMIFLPGLWPAGPVRLLLLLFGSSALGGVLIGFLLITRARCGIDPDLLEEYSGTLLSDETLLLLQTGISELHVPLSIILGQAETSPVIFFKDSSFDRRSKPRPEGPGPEARERPSRTTSAWEKLISGSEDQASPELLKRIRKDRKWVRETCTYLTEVGRIGQGLSGVAEWVIDNEYMLVRTIRDIQINLPRRFYNSLPASERDPYRGRLPDVYRLARDIVAETGLHLSRDRIVALVDACQEKRHLNIAELWALPQMLRIALIENIKNLAIRAQANLSESRQAAFWANRLIAANRRDVNLLFNLLAELSVAMPEPSPHFGAELIDQLYDETDVLLPVQSWLERTLSAPLDELMINEQNQEASDQLAVGNAFAGLRRLIQLDWKELFEQLSCVERILRTDPAGVYPQMDFETRDRYRRVVEAFAHRGGLDEQATAETAIELARKMSEKAGPLSCLSHVGYFLVGSGRQELVQKTGCADSARQRIVSRARLHHCLIYLAGTVLLTSLISVLFELFGLSASGFPVTLTLLLLAIIPASQLSVSLLNHLITKLMPTNPLPKMDFKKKGISRSFKTLVIVPTLLISKKSIQADLEKIEIRYMANREKNLIFGLFTDFTDSTTPHFEGDSDLVQLAVDGIRSLNERYGEVFLLFHRERSWSESEQKYIGWERKRGKLEQLNDLLDSSGPEPARKMLLEGPSEQLRGIRFVITLDSDTHLPHGTARRLIETLAHPLNQPRFDASHRIAAGSYHIIQPRVTSSLPSSNRSLFSRLFSDSPGVDPYSSVVSDVYQDLSGESLYQGKAIYDVRAFNRLLGHRLPENLILSHDLLEGAHGRVGLASDIELYDEFPPDYLSYAWRLHRWIRGDWQIASWLFPRVPLPDGKWGKNPLSLFNRWKIFDNLRRSLVPVSCTLLLAASWMAGGSTPFAALLLVLLCLFWPSISNIIDILTTRNGLKNFSFSQFRRNACRSLVEVAIMPHLALMTIGAISRALYRLLISHRNLLEWSSSQLISYRYLVHRRILPASLFAVSALSAGTGFAAWKLFPASLVFSMPVISLWILAPMICWFLASRPRLMRPSRELPLKDHRYLRILSRRTWRYFDDFVGPGSAWLPPDNYQVSHQDQIAMRTSPTNIGLWILSLLGARDSGYVSPNQFADRLEATIQTLDKLQKYKGHLLNWYTIPSLDPLEPRYISTVDSGNFLAALLAARSGLEEMRGQPVFDCSVFAGLSDCGSILQGLAGEEGLSGRSLDLLDRHLEIWNDPPKSPLRQVMQVREDAAILPDLLKEISLSSGELSDVGYWCEALASQITQAAETIESHLGWILYLLEKGDNNLSLPSGRMLQLLEKHLPGLPSLSESGRKDSCPPNLLQALRDIGLSGPLAGRLTRARNKSRTAAENLDRKIVSLEKNLEALAGRMNMSFLYCQEQKLFSVGYNVATGRHDSAYYDLLASEARLASYVAIARGEIPMEHWFCLGRPHARVGGHRVLMSWTGTMFEYLMPLLLLHTYENSLLHRAVDRAVDIQVQYGNKNRVPWGMSESAYGNLDLNKTYQYMAFGVPSLSLKRPIKNQLVIAPYAALLAIGIHPKAAVRNLKWLDNLGLYDEYGFYESIDFSRKATPEGEQGVVIKTYMAHHQGMVFISLVNFLHGDLFRRRFHSDVRIKAFEPLLQERIPTLPPLQFASTREKTPMLVDTGGREEYGKRFTTPHTTIPKTRLLSNGTYNLMITNTGGGYSQWNGHELTRWRCDRTSEPWGSYLYIYEEDEDNLWSATYHPTGVEADNYDVEFTLDRVVFSRTDFGIHNVMEVIVSPEDDVEIRRLSLSNKTERKRVLSLTSYLELCLAPHESDLQHPAFNKLFIQTEYLPESNTLLAYRRSGSSEPPDMYVANRITAESPEQGSGFETDRRRFIGRGRTLARPKGAVSSPGNSQGFVLDPVFSLRKTVVLEPGQHCEVSFILAVASSRSKVLSLADGYSEPHQIYRAIDFAWRKAQIELRLLHIQPEEARWFQQLANHLIFPNQKLRATADQIEENYKGQSGLWPYGISGDLPIIMVTIAETQDLKLVLQLLQAHTYWRMRGFPADLLILNEEEGGYEQPLRDRLISLIQAHSPTLSTEQRGKVFLRNAEQIPEEDIRLMKAASRIVLVAARGDLAQQLGVAGESTEQPGIPDFEKRPQDSIQPLPEIELLFDNGFGGFTPDGREYVITVDPGNPTPAPWANIIANPTFGTMVTESGGGFTWHGNSQRNRLTQWSNDPVLDPPPETVYLRDEMTGDFWTPTPRPVEHCSPCRVRHGAGYSIFERHSFGIGQRLVQFVPNDDDGGRPVKIQQLTLTNDTDRWRALSVTYYLELTLGEHREKSEMHLVTRWDNRNSIMLGYNRYHPEYSEQVTFAALEPSPKSHTGDRGSFLGRNRTAADPAAMESARLDNVSGARLDPCAALQTRLELGPGASKTVITLLGQAGSKDEAYALSSRYRSPVAVQEALDQTIKWWDRLLGSITVKTPDTAADIMINRWLLYQSLSCRVWGRSAFYQSGGAFGFRDQLQDVTAFLASFPELARRQIVLAAGRQFREGDVQHWWHPPSGAGIRSRISDDLLWLPYLVAEYVRVTGDRGVLDEDVPFLQAPPLEPGQHEVFSIPEQSPDSDTLFEHCRRALDKGLTAGPNGLPLFGGGDWNDGMNLVGAEGKGESVWLGWFIISVLDGMAELARLTGNKSLADSYAKKKEKLRKCIEKEAWDGEWYLRGRFDDGSPLGSARNEEARIDSLPQSWAWLSEAADPKRAETAIESAWDQLVLPEEQLVLLFDPPFDKSGQSPGYIKAYPPGVRENGGQYTHAAIWLAMAMARKGDGERAVRMLKMMNPVEHSSSPEKAGVYGIEPYAVAADVYRLAGKEGKGGWSWYTGSAAWMYRAWTEEILGLKRRGNFLVPDPVIPPSWPGFSAVCRFDQAEYLIEVENPDQAGRGVRSVEVDGKAVKNKKIPISEEGRHRVLIRLGPAK